MILDKAEFNSKISSFFTSSFFSCDIGQDSVLSSILFTLYLSSLFHIFEKRTKNLKIPISFLSFVNNGLFISQEKSFEKSNSILYNIIFSLLKQFRLVIKHEKSEIFHF